MHEVKVFDGAGNLKFVISREVLIKQASKVRMAMLSERDRKQIIKFGDDPREKNKEYLDTSWYRDLSYRTREWNTDADALSSMDKVEPAGGLEPPTY